MAAQKLLARALVNVKSHDGAFKTCTADNAACTTDLAACTTTYVLTYVRTGNTSCGRMLSPATKSMLPIGWKPPSWLDTALGWNSLLATRSAWLEAAATHLGCFNQDSVCVDMLSLTRMSSTPKSVGRVSMSPFFNALAFLRTGNSTCMPILKHARLLFLYGSLGSANLNAER